MYHKAMEHLFPLGEQDPQKYKYHGCKCNLIDANRSASTTGKQLGGNQDSKTGSEEGGIETAMKKIFAGSWFPQTENDDDCADHCELAEMLEDDSEIETLVQLGKMTEEEITELTQQLAQLENRDVE